MVVQKIINTWITTQWKQWYSQSRTTIESYYLMRRSCRFCIWSYAKEACVKFREYTWGGCELKLYGGVYYLLKKIRTRQPNVKIVALLHDIQTEIHFVSTEMDPADFTVSSPEGGSCYYCEATWRSKIAHRQEVRFPCPVSLCPQGVLFWQVKQRHPSVDW